MLYVYIKENCEAAFKLIIVASACWNNHNKTCTPLITTDLQWNNTQSRASQTTISLLKRVDWILKSHHVCMIQTTNTLLLNCEQNARGLWGESMGPICQSSTLVNMLEWVGQSSVTPRHITASLSFTSSFLTLWRGFEDRLLCVNTKWGRSSSELDQKLCLKSKNPYSFSVCVRDLTQVTYITDLISLKKKKITGFFAVRIVLPLFMSRAFSDGFYGTVTQDCRLLKVH